ncbi:histone-lysine N-methyltransferase SETMAR [Trichonephila clavipes]|nr:histone-lysine N-methyltransferase SETMAR [Trichonephila clavipes]
MEFNMFTHLSLVTFWSSRSEVTADIPFTITMSNVSYPKGDKVIFDAKDAPPIGRLIVENVDKITEIIEVDRHFSSRNITQERKIDDKTVLSHLLKIRFKKKLDWYWKGIIYFEFLPYGQTINSDLYSQQLDYSKLAIDQKRPELDNRRGVVFHQDNAMPHTSVVTHQKLSELGWEVLIHAPYSPDLAPRDYHFLLALQNFLSGNKLGSREDRENRLLEFFTNDQGM